MAQQYIDMTPSWVEILPTWLMMFEQAVEGNCSNPALIKDNARKELRRMAEAADRWNKLGDTIECARDATLESIAAWPEPTSPQDAVKMFFEKIEDMLSEED
jgi:hypothetical protein